MPFGSLLSVVAGPFPGPGSPPCRDVMYKRLGGVWQRPRGRSECRLCSRLGPLPEREPLAGHPAGPQHPRRPRGDRRLLSSRLQVEPARTCATRGATSSGCAADGSSGEAGLIAFWAAWKSACASKHGANLWPECRRGTYSTRRGKSPAAPMTIPCHERLHATSPFCIRRLWAAKFHAGNRNPPKNSSCSLDRGPAERIRSCRFGTRAAFRRTCRRDSCAPRGSPFIARGRHDS